MPVVAIAGGTSPSTGRSITVGILERYTGEWNVLLLSRTSKRPLWLQSVDPEHHVRIEVVDYDSVESIAAVLKGVHTFMSVILTKDPTQPALMLRLLDAAVQTGVSRFVPSYWGVGVDGWSHSAMLQGAVAGVWEACLEAEKKSQGRLQVSRFNCGMHMNYLAIGAKQKRDGLEDFANGYAVGDDTVCQGVDKEGDMADGTGGFLVSPITYTAELPVTETGASPRMTTTTIRDVGRFVAAALAVETWVHDMDICGETIRLEEILRLAQKIRGKDFETTLLSPAQIEQDIALNEKPPVTPGKMMKGLWLDLKLAVAKDTEGVCILPPVVNKMCPDVRPTTVAELLQQAWA